MTTGTPPGRDRGAKILCESALGVKAAVDLPIQGQCEPPDDDIWFSAHERRRHRFARHASRSRDRAGAPAHHAGQGAGARSSATSRRSRRPCRCSDMARSRPTSSPGSATAQEAILDDLRASVAIGVYPFVVPFVPIAGTPLESHPTPSPAFMHEILGPLAQHAARRRTQRRRHQGRLRQMRRLLGAFDLRTGAPVMIFEPFKPFLASAYQIKFATEAWETARRRHAAPPGVLRRTGAVRRRRSRRGR